MHLEKRRHFQRQMVIEKLTEMVMPTLTQMLTLRRKGIKMQKEIKKNSLMLKGRGKDSVKPTQRH